MGLLLVLVAVAILTYSSLAYFAERETQVPKTLYQIHRGPKNNKYALNCTLPRTKYTAPILNTHTTMFAKRDAQVVYFDQLANITMNCTDWIPDRTSKDMMNHPCYHWTFIEAFW